MDGRVLRRLGIALLAAAVLAAPGSPARAATVPTDVVHLLVRFGVATSAAERDDALRAVGGAIEGEIGPLGVTRVAAPFERGTDPAALVAALAVQTGVTRVEADARVHLDFAPNDPYWSTDPFTGLGQWGAKKILLDRALDLVSPTLAQVIVAVIDTGVDATHPDLSGAVLGGTTVLASASPVCLSGAYPIGTDDNSHGTHVAGVIAARSNNGVGIVGIAQNAHVLPIKALDCTGSGSVSDIASAIVYAVDHGARLINISVGSSSDSSTLLDAVQYAGSHNALVIAAAGNCGSGSTRCLNTPNLVEYPAAYPGVVGVGATSMDDTIAPFSTQGPQVAISAPGVRILSTTPHYATYESDHGSTADYALLSGTSQATPFVTGLAALLLGVDPTLTAQQLAARLASTADDLGIPGNDVAYGAGRLDALRAVTATLPAFSATYDTSAVPRSATSGTTFSAKVTVTNTSQTPWPAGGTTPVKLSYHWLDANGSVTVWDGLRTSLPADVLPGAGLLLPATVLAPPTRDPYTLRFDLVRDGVAWFSARGVRPADVSVAVGSGLAASYATVASTATLVAAAPAPLAVTLANTGTRPWSAGGQSPVHLSYHWLRAGVTAAWDGARAPSFASDVQPGQTVTVQLPVAAPADLGAYTLRLDLVEEGVTWFSTEGVAPRDIAYVVTSGFAATYTPVALTALLPGERATLRVGLRNDGVVAWPSAGLNPIHLAAHLVDASGTVLVWDGARTALAADVAPGASSAALVTIDAPNAPGAYRARVDLVREGISWFSGLGIAPADVPVLVVADYRAQLPTGPLSVSRASPVAQTTITNTSSTLWTTTGPSPVRVAVHWYDATGKVLLWDGPRTDLGHDVAPGETVALGVALGAPPAGAAAISIDLVSEGQRWFGAGPVRPVALLP